MGFAGSVSKTLHGLHRFLHVICVICFICGSCFAQTRLAAEVKAEFLHAWSGYKKYAWGHDELKPLSKTHHDWYGQSLLITPVDSLPSLILLGFPEEAEKAKKLIVETLSFDKDVDFLGTPVLSRGESDAFVARMSSDGDLLWVKTYGAERADVGLGIDADRGGNLIVTGGFETTIDLGGGTYKTKGYMDGWVAKLAPDGSHQWSRRFGGKDVDVGLATATTADGTPFLAGSYRFQLDLQPDGPTAVQSEGQKLAKPDMFVARLVP